MSSKKLFLDIKNFKMLRFYVHRIYKKIKLINSKLLHLPKVGRKILTQGYREKFKIGSQKRKKVIRQVLDFRLLPRCT